MSLFSQSNNKFHQWLLKNVEIMKPSNSKIWQKPRAVPPKSIGIPLLLLPQEEDSVVVGKYVYP